MARAVAVLALVSGWAFAGCTKGAADDGAQAVERRAALHYGQAAASARALQQTFLDEWKASREAETVATLRSVGRDRVLPALTQYVRALQAMPVEGERLRTLHGQLVDAWLQFGTRLARYYERVTAENLPKRNATLQTAWTELGARIVAYRRQLRGLYDTMALRMPEDGAATPPPGAAEER